MLTYDLSKRGKLPVYQYPYRCILTAEHTAAAVRNAGLRRFCPQLCNLIRSDAAEVFDAVLNG